LILLFTLGNVWFLFLKLVNLLRLHPINVRAGERFSVLFVFIRLSLISPIMVTLIQPLNWYNTELNIEIPGVTISPSLTNDNESKELAQEAEQEKERESEQDVLSASELLLSRVNEDNTSEIKQADTVINAEVETSEPKTKYTNFDRAIATFVYEYETFQLSRCEKSATERVSIIGEDVILVAEKMPEHELGYKFSARACKLRDYKEQ